MSAKLLGPAAVLQLTEDIRRRYRRQQYLADAVLVALVIVSLATIAYGYLSISHLVMVK